VNDVVVQLTILTLAAFVGFVVIAKVPQMLHTPLMSATNAIHGVVLVGAILVLGREGNGTLVDVLSFIAVVFGTLNVVGGFVVTDRMLGMFRSKDRAPASSDEPGSDA
jgi:NAD(P) transhydrogenase subunit alpha